MKKLENVVVNVVETPNLLLKSKQEGFDFVINPYTGCPYACIVMQVLCVDFLDTKSSGESLWI